ncbi:MAG: hypothetical protein JW889_10990 [Verrucomicrobia bacterium]|nr:hypothetical protein [Verrucomicrobiota bacterium]
MDEALELANYLPLSLKTPKEQEYVEFLWDAFETNYTHGRYQFGESRDTIPVASYASALDRVLECIRRRRAAVSLARVVAAGKRVGAAS